MTRAVIPLALLLAVVVVSAGCGSSSSSSNLPEGAVAGELDKSCGFGGCANSEAKDAASASDVWCEWNARGHVLVHITFENNLNAHVTAKIVPRYEIENGGTHGDSIGSEKTVKADASSAVISTFDAGHPKGVPDNTPISACTPRLLDIDITNPWPRGDRASTQSVGGTSGPRL